MNFWNQLNKKVISFADEACENGSVFTGIVLGSLLMVIVIFWCWHSQSQMISECRKKNCSIVNVQEGTCNDHDCKEFHMTRMVRQ